MANFIITGVDDKVLITVCCATVIFIISIILLSSRFQNFLNQHIRSSTDISENHHSFDNEVCPICFGVHRFAIETNCGHKFCGSCVRTYLTQSSAFLSFSNRMSCPLCRQDVNILLLCFTSEENTLISYLEERNTVERFVHEYNIHFGRGSQTWWSYLRDSPVLLKHMLFDFFTFGGLVLTFRLRVIICCLSAIVYFLSPFDLLPEAVIGVFGFIDDILVFVLCISYVSIIYQRLIIRRATINVQ
ncbi:conserved hypothetical protein [Pediculus humanus corporis]|uniref:E3 ubiquitin-protein ligase RNF170 n=1 Tax=Pediculus humanus subsp. corporis TaxID=121224 RepID=E0VJ62_PEDHC|nr:uncharacterized protein Phum_PHUM238930 [Pediculus humanus corporis]EEB13418.1 conserved hypothetical protein [Pediculus humanus corporis]